MTTEIRTMVAGFFFHSGLVLLVRKNKPDWQAGLWNAVGGKAEPDETPVEAMVREFHEEVGVQTLPGDWRHFATEFGPGYCVHFFAAERVPGNHEYPDKNDVGEKLSWWNQRDVCHNIAVVGNVRWLLPMAMDWRRTTRPVVFDTNDDIRERASW